jgi:hypothetical protein
MYRIQGEGGKQMKIESIKEPRQLDDGTVKASITVSDDDFIPLIQLIKDAKKGTEIAIEAKQGEDKPEDYYFTLASQITRDLADKLRVEYERGRVELADEFNIPLTPLGIAGGYSVHGTRTEGNLPDIKVNSTKPDVLPDPELAEIKEGVKSSVVGILVEESPVVAAGKAVQRDYGSPETIFRDGLD